MSVLICRAAGIAGLCALACSPLRAAELPGATAGEIGVSPSSSLTNAVPIAVPVGTTGLQPKITLQYDSLAGNGPAGMGWSISGLAVITRCPMAPTIDGQVAGAPELDPVDFDGNDKLCLNGQRLVAASGAHGTDGTEYRTRGEEFSKIMSFGRSGFRAGGIRRVAQERRQHQGRVRLRPHASQGRACDVNHLQAAAELRTGAKYPPSPFQGTALGKAPNAWAWMTK